MNHIQQILKGMVDPIVLATLSRLPMYGYQIIKEIQAKTSGYIKLTSGTIYPALARLEKKGLVTSYWSQVSTRRSRRYYQITAKGREWLASNQTRWQEFCIAISSLMLPHTPQEAHSQELK